LISAQNRAEVTSGASVRGGVKAHRSEGNIVAAIKTLAASKIAAGLGTRNVSLIYAVDLVTTADVLCLVVADRPAGPVWPVLLVSAQHRAEVTSGASVRGGIKADRAEGNVVAAAEALAAEGGPAGRGCALQRGRRVVYAVDLVTTADVLCLVVAYRPARRVGPVLLVPAQNRPEIPAWAGVDSRVIASGAEGDVGAAVIP